MEPPSTRISDLTITIIISNIIPESHFTKKIVVLGATGSIGRDVLKVVRGNPDDFEIIGLSCNTNNDQRIRKTKRICPYVGLNTM